MLGKGFVGWEVCFDVSFLHLIRFPLLLVPAFWFLLCAAFLVGRVFPSSALLAAPSYLPSCLLGQGIVLTLWLPSTLLPGDLGRRCFSLSPVFLCPPMSPPGTGEAAPVAWSASTW